MPKQYRNTLKAHAFAVVNLADVLHDLAHEHRVAASAEEAKKAIPRDRFPDWIASLAELSTAAERLLELEIELARRYGMTWDEIADVLGVRRQSAWERYGTHRRWDRTHRTSRYRQVRRAAFFRQTAAGKNAEEIAFLRDFWGMPSRGAVADNARHRHRGATTDS